ncbi:MAG: Vi polysaccharide biosynthesis protein VipA/TviB [Acidiferrobacteraceae bacterium]|nr:Vi polysaccharide biosynthesis protein VipA/TviB [Acidiferrobacteraceae bacterium]
MKDKELNIAIIGLGYVGLPLAIEFGKVFSTVGFDINQTRIKELNKNNDTTLEVDSAEFVKSSMLALTSDERDLSSSNIFIVTVPTPLDINSQPDLESLKKACLTVGTYLKPNDIVVFESTVYPGATEEYCVPILEKKSGLMYIHEKNKNTNKNGFYCGYSPERINPGDKERSLKEIIKVTSASTTEALEVIDDLYNSILNTGTIRASSIKIAEAAKVIENTQRDVNIALINEFSLIFKKLSIDTEEILKIASTKWNFNPFSPGLVGGHCIGVDPYYLAYKAINSGYYPKLILSGRETNNKMGFNIADEVITIMAKKRISVLNAKVLILGFTFKENCPDIRNTRVIDIISELDTFGCHVDVYDPMVDQEKIMSEYSINLVSELNTNTYDAIVLAVAHQQFKDMGIANIRNYAKENHVIYDVKYLFKPDEVDGRL